MRPWLLVGLALLLPILVAFLYRTRDRVATVPSTLLFRKVALSRLKNRRLRELLRVASFLACLGAVAALVLAAAEPRGFGDRRTIALVVDVSASMGGQTEAEVRDQVRRVLRQTTGRDSVVLIAAGAEPHPLAGPTTDSSRLDAAVDELVIEGGEADLAGALRLADGLVEGAHRARVWLISDGGAAAVEPELELTAPLRLLRVGQRRDNVGITVLAARPPADATSDADREVLVTVVASAGPPREVDLVVEADDSEIARRRLTIDGGEEAEATFRLRVPASELRARVEPRGFTDGLASDDEAVVALGSIAAPRAHLIAEASNGAAFFVERALRASGVSEVVRHLPTDAPTRLADGEIAVVVGAAPDTRIAGPTLYLDTRTGELPVHVGATLDAETAQLRSIDPSHPLTRGVDLDGATIAHATAVDLGPDDEEVVALDGGAVVATGGAGRERWVYLGIDPMGSDLVLRVAFPVLIANAVAALSGATDLRVAPTLPRAESALAPSEMLAGAPALPDPVPLPAGLPFLLAAGAALLLLGEGLAFHRGYAR
ncbi:MAG: VWA domain-containing protein [Sandaracinaceae bacterium]|nr:VWA domain-containing protein [Sandaracinaceae bacterium]